MTHLRGRLFRLPPSLFGDRFSSVMFTRRFYRKNFEMNDVVECIPSLIVSLNTLSTPSEIMVNNLRKMGEMNESFQVDAILKHGGIISVRKLLKHENIMIQGAAAMCLFRLSAAEDVSPNIQPRRAADKGIILTQSDNLLLLSPFLDVVTSEFGDLENKIASSRALSAILINYPMLSDELLKLQFVERIVPFLNSDELKSTVHGLKSSFYNILCIFISLSRSPNFDKSFKRSETRDTYMRILREIILQTTTICDLGDTSEISLDLKMIQHAAICIENASISPNFISTIEKERTFQAVVRGQLLWPNTAMMKAIKSLLCDQTFVSLLFDEGAHALILTELQSGPQLSRDLLCHQLASRLTQEAVKLKSPLLSVVVDDAWIKALILNFEYGTFSQSRKILEVFINLANANYSAQCLLLHHGVIYITLCLILSSIDVLRRGEVPQPFFLQERVMGENIVFYTRSLCLLISILSSKKESHGQLYIFGAAEILLGLFMNYDTDFVARKHVSVALANLITNEHLEHHIRMIHGMIQHSDVIPFPEDGEDTDAFTLNDILAKETLKRDEAENIQEYEVDHGIIFALRNFLENEVYSWK